MAAKILLVDDNELNRKLLRVILEFNGYEVVEASNGKEGIKLAKEQLPALVLMDVQMPVMDGIAALQAILADDKTSHIPVAAITSYAMKGDRERLLEKGFIDYIAKPIDKNDVLQRVKSLLKQGER